ncbi:histidine phosphatase family protein [bacterium]|nr:histidine phosphatase family protein [bacterium]
MTGLAKLAMPHDVFLLRHGQTEWNKEHRVQGQKNSDLTELLKVILTKDDLGAMINTMDVVYNLMDDTNTATLKMEGSKETGTFWDVSSTCSERGATTPFY